MLKCVLGWCLPLDYQKLESPIPDGAVHVDIDVEILDILSINDKEFSITMSMYFSVQWQESRLENNHPLVKSNKDIHRIWTNNTIEPGFWYPVSLEFLNDLWIPNVFIYNLKSFQNIAVLKRLAGETWYCNFPQNIGLKDSFCAWRKWWISGKVWNLTLTSRQQNLSLMTSITRKINQKSETFHTLMSFFYLHKLQVKTQK